MAELLPRVFAPALRGAHAGPRQEPSEATEEGARCESALGSTAALHTSFGCDRRVPLAPPRRSDFLEALVGS